MMKKAILLFGLFALVCLSALANGNERMLWGSINSVGNASASAYKSYNNTILLSWRWLPGDNALTAFDLYRSTDGGAEVKLNTNPIKGLTNWQDKTADRAKTNTYRLTLSGRTETIGTYTMTAAQATAGQPYVQIDLKDTKDVCALDTIWYEANDASVGDLDGDGVAEIVIKRLLTHGKADRSEVYEGTAAVESPHHVRHTVLYEAYKLDGTFMWRICSGPNIMLGNSSSFAIADYDGDGRCEMAIKTGEGTVFGDGQEIGDTDGDGVTDYREKGKHYIGLGPEYFSVVDGQTGRELARADYITRGRSEDWGDNYFKRASSLRVAVANVSGGNPSVIICRGVYERSVLEAWDYQNGQLTRRWHFDSHATGKGKDGKDNKKYASQGFHSLSVGDVDGDGRDEVVYGSMTVDDDGQGLYTSEYGHGDALHLGKFDPSREGLQIWSCQEFGKTMAVLRDARDGSTIWKANAAEDNDTGRGMIADIDPNSQGCEMWWYQSNAHSISAYAAKPGNGEVVLTLLDGIPQTAGVILRGEPNKTYRLYHAAEGVSYQVSNNYMQRVTTDTPLKQHPDATHWNYILAADHGTAKFFLVAEDTTLAKGKAYLKSNKQLSASAQSSGFQLVIEGDDVTGIGNLTPALSQGEGSVYDLQGRKVSEWGIGHSALKRGLYIVNGKKLYVACCASTDRR